MSRPTARRSVSRRSVVPPGGSSFFRGSSASMRSSYSRAGVRSARPSVVERYPGAAASACSRSLQSTSTSSRPTDRPEQPGGDTVAFHRWRDSSFVRVPPRLRGVLDRGEGALDAASRVSVHDVEGDQKGEARIPHCLHRRVPPSRSTGCGPSPPAGRASPRATSARGRAATPCPGLRRCPRGAGSDAGAYGGRRPAPQPTPPADRRARRAPCRAVEDDVAPVVERSQPQRRRDGRSQTTGAGCAPQPRVGHRQQRVGGSLDQDQIGSGGRRCGLVEIDRPDPPRRQVVEELSVTVVGPFRQRDRAARRQHREQDGRDGAHPGGEEQCAPPSRAPSSSSTATAVGWSARA